MTKLILGTKYKVSFEDCCVRGYFTSILKEIEMSEDESYPTKMIFENGVTLEDCWCGTFEEIDD
jgi:hypothetical protein